jgi:hypothetical protein
MWRLGARFMTQEPLQRDYVPFLTDAPPHVVDMANASEAAAVAAYWVALSDLAHVHYTNLSRFVDDLAALTSGNAYVYSAVRREYLHVKLRRPYLSPHVYQKMELPWQA